MTTPIKATSNKAAAKVTPASKRISAFPVDDPSTEKIENPIPTETSAVESKSPSTSQGAVVHPDLLERLGNPLVAGNTEVDVQEDKPKASSTAELPPITLPDHFDVTEEKGKIKITLEAYTTNCLSCKSLVPTAEKTFAPCHYSAGNKHCPAASAGIVFVGKRNHFLEKLLEARSQSDVSRLNRILDLLRKESVDVQSYVMRTAGVLQ